MPSKNPTIIKALKSGKISKKQYEKLPPHLLTAIIKSKKKNMNMNKRKPKKKK